jgi:hypothetical protein
VRLRKKNIEAWRKLMLLTGRQSGDRLPDRETRYLGVRYLMVVGVGRLSSGELGLVIAAAPHTPEVIDDALFSAIGDVHDSTSATVTEWRAK